MDMSASHFPLWAQKPHPSAFQTFCMGGGNQKKLSLKVKIVKQSASEY